MKPTKANLMRLAKKLGATVHIDHASESLTVEAPKGHHFALLQIHESCSGCSGYTAPERYEYAIADLIDDGGDRPIFERCTAKTCDIWDEESDSCEWWMDEDVYA